MTGAEDRRAGLELLRRRRSWGIWSGDGLGGLGERGDEGLVGASRFELKEKSEEMRLADLTGADNILGSLTVGEKEEKSQPKLDDNCKSRSSESRG